MLWYFSPLLNLLLLVTSPCLAEQATSPLAVHMTAVVQTELHGPLSLAHDVPVPIAAPGEVLIRVHYTALNRMDLLQAKGRYPLPPGTSDILGVEVSGVVVAAPTGSRLQEGDEVMALLPGGGYAEYCVCDERTVTPVPAGLSLLTASALPEAFMTAYQLLFLVARLQPGETVLMHAAASSVGQAAIQMAVHKGARVLVTTRSPQKLDTCLSLGAAGGVVVGPDRAFADEVLAMTGEAGVHVVLDPVGADYLQENLRALQTDGRLVSYGLLSGGVVPPELNSQSPTLLQQLLFKRVSLLGSTLRAREVSYKHDLLGALLRDQEAGFPAVSAGHVRVNVSLVLPLSEVVQAHEVMQRNENSGKIVLEVLAEGGAGWSPATREL
mmetsp:Transcript_8854/g.15069  ORF Transcript_8854/g.15069 Transcript_8854/m.15069 type:complete len:382 (+) Transcript_8854:64-1209(+)|eukprot:CAMPEP_0114428874 /NCGR_PEP_ID=MMETSP0103-20121206/9174_1 /TAXON_ID=37642 ORGANISM="Paraphysomonas imperforata, Strain PA2" /NCGR_SAMPLE_ID=MMETSP0103 /ASSEMBLY_ACC=CAM_ASM_000201 /LENGTH=381 /DNA_ID=CAMNT_0001598151 /DNA_START=34 /DNA_END=1179 /DNA_ORIENTATION=-